MDNLMTNALTALFSVEFVVFCIVISVAVLIFRRGAEALAKFISYLIPDDTEKFILTYESWIENAWREYILHFIPILFGGLIAYFVTSYPYPEPFAAGNGGRIFFGIVAGLCSAHVYRFLKSQLSKIAPVLSDILSKITGDNSNN